MSQPHLVLFWTYDIPNQKLFTKIADDLEYVAIEGGTKGFSKTFKGQVTNIEADLWDSEKHWISENYGGIHGYYQPDDTRTKKHPEFDWEQNCRFGLGPDGNYLDSLQRMQIIMEGHDMATILMPTFNSVGDVGIEADSALFTTPDKGLTIYKRVATRDVKHPKKDQNESLHWLDNAQPCNMQYKSKSYNLSDHDELLAAGCPAADVEKCRNGQWDSPKHPELQKYYVYPKTKNPNL